MKRLLISLLSMLVLAPASLWGATDAKVTAAKAARFFENREWASASAMYTLLIAENECPASVFAHAIVSADMLNDTGEEMRLLEEALHRSMPFDSVMSRVNEISLQSGCLDAYERFMFNAQESFPWLGRAIDRYLLQYYTFRHNGPMMVKYSELLLKGLPDDTGHLRTLAQGYLFANDTEAAIKVYREILTLDPDNYDALLAVGNYAHLHNDATTARSCLERAYAIHPTPYIASVLKNL